MAYESKKKEFSIKDELENYEKSNNKKIIREKNRGDSSAVYYFQALGLAFIGGICGLAIFFGVNLLWSIFSNLLFIVHGLAASVFCYEFIKPENRKTSHLIMVLIADVVSVFLTLVCHYLWSPAYAVAFKNHQQGVFSYLSYCFFNGPNNNIVWIMCLLMSLIGVAAGWLVYRFIREKSNKKTKRG